MTYYLLTASGVQNTNFAWSVKAVGNSAATEATVAGAWDSGWTQLWASLGAMCATSTILLQTSASTASPTFRQTTKTVTNRNNAGAVAGTGLPQFVAEVVTFRSVNATRYGHGRWYLPAVGSGALAGTGFVLSAASQTTIQTGMNNFLTAIRPVFQLVILHRKATLHGPGAGTVDIITKGDVSNLLHVQRRRQSKLVPTRVSITI